MSSDPVDAESKVSGNQANIPARIRCELGIDDGEDATDVTTEHDAWGVGPE
ncbi:hypothetical protein [Halomicrobium salinisoli]|uniref:hypothetical protein n=1 Tax=Halomicrobium salinisoli TaxID=2878391 RepID=UPI001CF04432|nr:hypothetical protein [Halomicrobium salinisoli]